MAHEQSTFHSFHQLYSFYIANRFWNCAERLEWLKNTYFSFSLHSSALILLTFHLFFYCLGWKQWKKLLCIAIWQWGKGCCEFGAIAIPRCAFISSRAIIRRKENLISSEIFITNGNWKLNVSRSPFFQLQFHFMLGFWVKYSLPSIQLIVHRFHSISDPFPVHKSPKFPIRIAIKFPRLRFLPFFFKRRGSEKTGSYASSYVWVKSFTW